MVLYFSGTGNSAFIARRIAARTGDECEDLFERLRGDDSSELRSERAFVIVTPTYAWQIPHVLRDWLSKAKLTGNRNIYFVMTCGDDNGNAAHYLRKLCARTGMRFRGCASLIMPENYIALYDAPGEAQALRIVRQAEPAADSIARIIAAGRKLPDKKISAADVIKSSLVNAAFYPLIVHARKFRVTDACTGCGRCAKSCVMGSITMVSGRPQWRDKCTHCMACICGCPEKAIEYGNSSRGKPRYQCPQVPPSEGRGGSR